jgi:hypothetical protein
MEEYGPTELPTQGGSRRSRRRLDQHRDDSRMTMDEERIATSVQVAVDERLTDGLTAIQEQATGLMREIAGEVWRASGTDGRPEQERIISLLSRDQAIRSLLASSDERFQALALRTARLEDSLTELATSGRASRDAMQESLASIREIAESPTLQGVEIVRTKLEQVEHHIAAAFEHFDDRDRALTNEVMGQVKAHGELVARETAGLVEAMEEYVQTGAEAMAILAQRVEQQAEAFTVQDVTISEHVGEMVSSEIRPVAEQLELLSERVGLHGRDQDQIRAALERLVDARIRGVAQLIRSDSEALRGLIDDRSEGQVEALREAVDWRMAAFAERLDERLDQAADLVANRASEAAGAAIEERVRSHIDDRMEAVARLVRSDNQALAQAFRDHQMQMAAQASDPVDPELLRQTVRAIKELQAGMADDVQNTVERRFQSVSDQLHKETQYTAESMVKVAEILGNKIDRLSVRVDEGYGNELQVVIDRMGDAIQAMSSVRRPA